jgi:hypothetical protein
VKKLLPLTLTLCLLAPFAAMAQDPTVIENGDVVSMVKAGLKSDLIIAKIKSSRCRFDTFPSVLAELKHKGVPDDVLMAIVEFPNGQLSTEAAKRSARRSPESVPMETVEVVIPDGTPVEVETAYTVSSGDVEEGSRISFRVVRPIKVNDSVVVKSGATATARVTKAKKGGSWGRAGSLAWEMSDVTAVDGSRVPAIFSKGTKGDSKGGTVTAGIIVTSVLFWPAAPFWGFKKGKNAVVPAGRRFEVFTHGDTTVKVLVPVADTAQ